jgi:hypothetical protein
MPHFLIGPNISDGRAISVSEPIALLAQANPIISAFLCNRDKKGFSG